MSLREFFTGSGKIVFEDKFISIGLIRDALEKKFRLVILEESAIHMRCKIIRYARLYAAPALFIPNSVINVVIKREEEITTLYYDFEWPEYYWVVAFAMLGGILSATLPRIGSFIEATIYSIVFSGLILFFFGLLVFLDTKYVSSRIRRSLVSL